jgi:UDP-N-acetylglucosamine 1-carboxyvinyltransferase
MIYHVNMNKNSLQQKAIGQFIAELRKQQHITQKDFAKKLSTSQSAVARMEKGEQNFSTEMLLKISSVLDKNIISLSRGTISYQVEGGHKLSGTITTNTAKNTAVVLLFAALLNKGKTTLKKVPHIEEVHRIIEVLTSIDVNIKWQDSNVIIEPPKKINIQQINEASALKTRSAVLLLGSLSHLLTEYKLPHPGGCKLGVRTVNPHTFALEKLGMKITREQGFFKVNAKSKKPTELVMSEASDVAVENILLAAATIDGTTVIKKASANYQVQETCLFLQKLGIDIQGIGTATLTVHGRSDISKTVTYTLAEDPIESMLFITAAIVTKSSITIKRCPIDFLELELLKLEQMGFKYDILKRYKATNEFTNLVDIKTHPSKLQALSDKIHALPYPGINADNLPFFAPIATQAEGETLIHDWIYENRAIYYTELNKLGANVLLVDPHRAYVKGPTKLTGAEIITPPALRPAAVILVAMLAAKGTSVLRNVYTINRGYEDICPRLNSLGANIKILQDI